MSSPLERPQRNHILSVVLEDYCHVGPVSRVVPPDYWPRFESRVQRNTERTLDLLDEMGAKATFFVLGWIAEHQPQVVAEVARRGHEIASKGYWHRSIRQMTPEDFRTDVRRSKQVIEAATGVAVRGFRIPRGGFGPRDLWALDILSEEGFLYDSSLRPLGTTFMSEPQRRFVHRHEANGRSIWEVPLSTWKVGPCASRFPAATSFVSSRMPSSAARSSSGSGTPPIRSSSIFTSGNSIRSSRGSPPFRSCSASASTATWRK